MTTTATPTILDDPHVRAAMAAYDLEVHHVSAAAIAVTGEVVIVTAGGCKLRWRPGAPVVALTRGEKGDLIVCENGHTRGADLGVCRQCWNRAARGGDAEAQAQLTRSLRMFPQRPGAA